MKGQKEYLQARSFLAVSGSQEVTKLSCMVIKLLAVLVHASHDLLPNDE
jgi:hypothetical protein